jgi:hypothetical protein
MIFMAKVFHLSDTSQKKNPEEEELEIGKMVEPLWW